MTLPIGVHFDLFGLRQIHEEQRHDEEEARNSESNVFAGLVGLGHQLLNAVLHLLHFQLKSFAAAPVIAILSNHDRICCAPSTVGED